MRTLVQGEFKPFTLVKAAADKLTVNGFNAILLQLMASTSNSGLDEGDRVDLRAKSLKCKRSRQPRCV